MCANLLAGCAVSTAVASAPGEPRSIVSEGEKERTKSVSAGQKDDEGERNFVDFQELHKNLMLASNELYCVDDGDESGDKGRVLKATIYGMTEDKHLKWKVKYPGTIYKEEGWLGVLKRLSKLAIPFGGDANQFPLFDVDVYREEDKIPLANAKVTLTDAQGMPIAHSDSKNESDYVAYTDLTGKFSMMLPESTSDTYEQIYYLKVERHDSCSDSDYQMCTVRYINVKKLKEEYKKKLEAENIPMAEEVVEGLENLTEEEIRHLWEAGLEEAKKKGVESEKAYREEYVLDKLVKSREKNLTGAERLISRLQSGEFWNAVEEKRISPSEKVAYLYHQLPAKIRGAFKLQNQFVGVTSLLGLLGRYGDEQELYLGAKWDKEEIEEARELIGDTLWDEEMTNFTCGLVDFAVEFALVSAAFQSAGNLSKLDKALTYEKATMIKKAIQTETGLKTVWMPLDLSECWAQTCFRAGVSSGTKGVLKKLDELEALEAKLLTEEEGVIRVLSANVGKAFELTGWEVVGTIKRSDLLNAAKVRKIVEKTLAMQKTTAAEEVAAKWIASADTPLEKAVMTDVVNALSDDVVMAAAKAEKLPAITAENVDDLVIDIVDDVPAAGGLRKITEEEILDGTLLEGKVSTSVEQLPALASGEVSALASVQQVQALEVKQLQNIVDACAAVMTRIAGSTTAVETDTILGVTAGEIKTANAYGRARENLTEWDKEAVSALVTILAKDGDMVLDELSTFVDYNTPTGNAHVTHRAISHKVREDMDERHLAALSVKENLIRSQLYQSESYQKAVENYGGLDISASYKWQAIRAAHRAFGVKEPATVAQIHPVVRTWLDQVNDSISGHYGLLFQGNTLGTVLKEISGSMVVETDSFGYARIHSITGDQIKEILRAYGIRDAQTLRGFPFRDGTELAFRQYGMAAKVKEQAEQVMIDAYAESLLERSTQQMLGVEAAETAGDGALVVSAYKENAGVLALQAQEAITGASRQYLFELLENECMALVERAPKNIQIGNRADDVVTAYRENPAAQEVMKRTLDELRTVENPTKAMLIERFKQNIEQERRAMESYDRPDSPLGDRLAGDTIRTIASSGLTDLEYLTMHEMGHVYGMLKSLGKNEALGIDEMYVDLSVLNYDPWYGVDVPPPSTMNLEPGEVILWGVNRNTGALTKAGALSEEEQMRLQMAQLNAGIGALVAEAIWNNGRLTSEAEKDLNQAIRYAKNIMGKKQPFGNLLDADKLAEKFVMEQFHKIHAAMLQDKEKLETLCCRFIALENSEWARRRVNGSELEQWFAEAGISVDKGLAQVDMEAVFDEVERYQLLAFGVQQLEENSSVLNPIFEAMNHPGSTQSFDFRNLETTERLAAMGQQLRTMGKVQESLERQGSGQGLSARESMENFTDSIRALAQAEREFATLKLTDRVTASGENAMQMLEYLKDNEGTNLYGLAVAGLADVLSAADEREANNGIVVPLGESKRWITELTGRVIDSETKEAVTSASVELYYMEKDKNGNAVPGEHLRTRNVSRNGSFTFDRQEEGAYYIKIQAEGYKTKEVPFETKTFKKQSISYPPYRRKDIGDIELEKWDEDALLYAFVREEGTDKPIKGAAISFYRTDSNSKSVRWQTEKTNKFGEASHVILGDGYGEYHFTVSAEGYEKVTVDKKITKENRSLSVKLVPIPKPTSSPTVAPTVTPTVTPSVKPSATPSVKPSATPSVKPSATPTVKPTATPSVKPMATPSIKPSVTPSVKPTATPSVQSTVKPTATPGSEVTVSPVTTPSLSPSVQPPTQPTAQPTGVPTGM